MNKLFKIETRNNIMAVDWILSNVCNYKCTYCSPDSNGGDLYWPDIENCRIAIERITEQSSHDHRIYTILCLLYTSPSPRDRQKSRMPSSA